MGQTTLDQFYKVTSSNKIFASEKSNSETLSNLRNAAISKKKGQSSQKLRTSICKKNSKQISYKINERQQVTQNNVSLGSEISHSSKTDVKYSPHKVVETGTATSPTTKHTSPIRNQHSPVSHNGSQFTPKTPSSIKNALNKSQRYAQVTPRRLFKDRMDELISATINNLNLAKEGAITKNNINLEKVYSSRVFNYKYSPINTTVSIRYEIDDIVKPTETYSLHFFLVIVTVFSKLVNCGYFNEDELDFIFSLLTLSKDAQALLIRILKRKNTWHRISNIEYNEISENLEPIFNELISKSILKINLNKKDMSIALNLLQVDEIHKLCKEFKINAHGKKENYIQAIQKFCKKTKPLFSGMPSPATKLCTSVDKLLGKYISLNTRVKQIIDKIITLLMPNQDPSETLADIFFMIFKVETKEIKFPEVEISDFPIFASEEHLLDYIEAKNTLSDMLSMIEKKQWESVRNFGYLAAERLPLFLEVETQCLEDSTLPHHIRRFMPGYVWLKILSKSIDAFKKTKETMKAKEFLEILIKQDCHMKSRKGQWYIELIKIKMHHMKNLDASADLLSYMMLNESLTEVDELDLLDRASMLVKRKRCSQSTKQTVELILNNFSSRRLTYEASSITIEGTLCRDTAGKKSNWLLSNDKHEHLYGSVESLALYHYKCNGYPKGVHCEGALPITLFGILFSDEIYNINVPGAYVSLYQDAPLDLYSPEFYKNRKEKIDKQLQIIRTFDTETLCTHLKYKFNSQCEYKSISFSQGKLFDSISLQEIAYCLGVQGVVGICERLIHNFSLWKAGFPDLIVWNIYTKQYKIVEVKGPSDSLSTKQKLWLQYLNRFGLNTEICYCKSNTSNTKHGRKRKRC